MSIMIVSNSKEIGTLYDISMEFRKKFLDAIHLFGCMSSYSTTIQNSRESNYRCPTFPRKSGKGCFFCGGEGEMGNFQENALQPVRAPKTTEALSEKLLTLLKGIFPLTQQKLTQ